MKDIEFLSDTSLARGSCSNISRQCRECGETKYYTHFPKRSYNKRPNLREVVCTSCIPTTDIEINDYKVLRKAVLERDQYTCHYCNKPGNTIDHKIPLSEGGKRSPANCVCCCDNCNQEKGSLPYEEYIILKKNRDLTQFFAVTTGSHSVIVYQCMGCKLEKYYTEFPKRSYNKRPNSRIPICNSCVPLTNFKLGDFKVLKNVVLSRDQNTCHYCNEVADTISYKKQISLGGKKSPANAVCTCHSCLHERGGMSYETYIRYRKGQLKISFNKNGIRIEKALPLAKQKIKEDCTENQDKILDTSSKNSIKVTNLNSMIGESCKIVLKCKECGFLRHYLEFPKKGGQSKENARRNRRKKVCKQCMPSYKYKKIANMVGKHIANGQSYKLTTDTELLKTYNNYFFLHNNGKQYDEVKCDLISQYVREGSCKIVEVYPFVLVFDYPIEYEWLKPLILNRDNYICQKCGSYGEEVTHIKPQNSDGLNTPANCYTVCNECNINN
ncbi:HNH endonuclease [Priestia megaterium]|uniref:HNH endonuclease n=1 Tax=Priestia megaterium TaxID=1404 RepID=UPI002E21FCF6|nr:HNH endonuclease [Priestia megaterium]MED4285286.1 HNH endonuclease [Priestia megaterium]